MKVARITIELHDDGLEEPMSDELTAMVSKYMAEHLRSHAEHAARLLGRAMTLERRVDLSVTVAYTKPVKTK